MQKIFVNKLAPKKRKVEFISAVKRFYDKILTQKVLHSEMICANFKIFNAEER
jgi:hypothetical protein